MHGKDARNETLHNCERTHMKKHIYFCFTQSWQSAKQAQIRR